MMEYVEQYMSSSAELLDLVSSVQGVSGGSGNKSGDETSLVSFPPHLTASEITARLRARTLLKGVLRCERGDYSQCYVIVHSSGDGDSFRQSLLISGALYYTKCIYFFLLFHSLIHSLF